MHLLISIVTYQSDPEQLEATVSSLAEAIRVARTGIPSLQCTLWLIENDTVEQGNHKQMCSYRDAGGLAQFDMVRLELSPTNLGYGAGHNLSLFGERGVGYDFQLILNPDVVVDESALIEGLHYFQQHPSCALLAPRASDEAGQYLFLCKRYPGVMDLLLRGFAPAALRRMFDARLAAYEMRQLEAASYPVQVPIISGCFMLARGAALREVGGFDEAFFLYFEDFDLSLRMAAQGEVTYLPRMAIQHFGGKAAKKGWRHIRLFAVSAWRFYRKHGWVW